MKSDLTAKLHRDKETVLLIDDDDMIADLSEMILRKSGYDVIVAKSGKEAIEVYKENHRRIDMVILDMILPDMGGGDTYDRLKEINPGIKALLASGYDIDYQGRDIMKRGCNDFIQKPFNLNELLEKIREILT